MNPKSARHEACAGGSRAVSIALVVLACAALSGCVHRRFTVRTNPPGARVFVDNFEIGTTPISHDFVYYGTRKIRLVKDGYETLTILQPMPTPWYDLPGIDFVTENLWPGEIHDHRVLDYQLQPQVIVPTEQLLARADDLRRAKNPAVAGAVPAGGAVPIPPGNVVPGGTPETLPPPSLPPATPPSNTPGTYPPANLPPSSGSGLPKLPYSPAAWPTSPPPTAGSPSATTPPSNTPTRNFSAPAY